VKHLVQFELPDGTSVFVEVEDVAVPQRVSRGIDIAQKAEHGFVQAIERLRPAAEAILHAFRELNTPAEMGLEFGIKFNAKAGAIIASVDSEATFKVTLKWTNKT
jgi:hypothetical protein